VANRFVIIKWPGADAHDKMWTTHLKLWTEGEAKLSKGVADTK
jgi:hypothetical protein